MVPCLYLDTARLGQMSPAAQCASRDFVGFAGEVGGAIHFDRFMQHGLEACSAVMQSRYRGLADWKGVASLKRQLCSLARVEAGLPMLLAGRSSQLMKFAAILMCRPCRNILVTDLGWPDYHRILAAECARSRCGITSIALCDELLRGEIGEDEIVDRLRSEFGKYRCDGLFLTAVNCLGIRLPVQRIQRAIAASQQVRFVVVDGAQDFRHVSSDLSDDCCDLYLTGCHKWLGAYYPLGLAFYGRRRSRGMIETMLAEVVESWKLDDPLLRMVEQVCNGTTRHAEETVNLSALFSCQGAVTDAIRTGTCHRRSDAALRVQNAEQVAELAAASGWSPRFPHPTLRSGVLLLQAERNTTRRLKSQCVRSAFQDNGVALTAYDDGLIRLSMPATPLQQHELDLIELALRRVA